MTSIDIYSILSSKPHNPHYLNRYWKFIQYCQESNSINTKQELGYTEKHHICPKAKDLFPEYKSFKDNKWNKVILTARQHFIAHFILYKTYKNSMSEAFMCMTKRISPNQLRYTKMSNKLYSNLRIECTIICSDRMNKLSENNMHPFQNIEFIEENKIRSSIRNVQAVQDGTHYLQSDKHKTEARIQLTEMAKHGCHPAQSIEARNSISSHQIKLIENNNHNFKTLIKSKRENVKILREILAYINLPYAKRLDKDKRTNFGKGWCQKSDEWINSKIEMLKPI